MGRGCVPGPALWGRPGECGAGAVGAWAFARVSTVPWGGRACSDRFCRGCQLRSGVVGGARKMGRKREKTHRLIDVSGIAPSIPSPLNRALSDLGNSDEKGAVG